MLRLLRAGELRHEACQASFVLDQNPFLPARLALYGDSDVSKHAQQ